MIVKPIVSGVLNAPDSLLDLETRVELFRTLVYVCAKQEPIVYLQFQYLPFDTVVYADEEEPPKPPTKWYIIEDGLGTQMVTSSDVPPTETGWYGQPYLKVSRPYDTLDEAQMAMIKRGGEPNEVL